MKKIMLFSLMGFLALAFVDAAEKPVSKKVVAPAFPVVTVYRTATCGCCKSWVAHLQQNGFEVTEVVQQNVDAFKDQMKIPSELRTCHTASVAGYAIEGHVPAKDIQRLLKERPEVLGIATPGMPTGSPGMEVGERQDPFDVVTFAKDGKTTVFAQYRGN